MKSLQLINLGIQSNNNVIIGNQVKIGKNVLLGNFVIIGDKTVIEENCKIGHGCVIGSGNIIRKGSKIKQNVVTARGTVIGENCFIGPMTVTIRDQKENGYGPDIGKDTFIGAGCVIYGSIYGRNVTIGASSFVKNDITESGVYGGIPARRIT